jgi:hypothetical protein
MANYVKCDHCGYYPSVSGKKCSNCGKTVNSSSIGLILIALILFLLFIIGPLILAYYGFKNLDKKWIGYTSLGLSVVVPIAFYFILKTPHGEMFSNQDIFTKDNAFFFYPILVGNIIGFLTSIVLVLKYNKNK